MKHKSNISVLAAICSIILHSFFCLQAMAQGTAFTYQGRLNTANGMAAGFYDLQFTLFNTNITGTALAGSVTNAATPVSNGLFTATIDFGGSFDGTARWLEIAVRTNGTGAFTTLAPRQPLTPAPYAIFAGSASNVLGSIPVTQITGTISTNLLPGFQPNYNTVSGGSGNSAGPGYATVAGGQGNTVNNTYGMVGGGFGNTAGYMAMVPGGNGNNAAGFFSFAAGQYAKALHQGAFVWADSQNASFSSAANDTFNVRAQGGVNFQTANGVNVNGQPLLTNNAAGVILNGTFSGNGSGLTNLNAAQLVGMLAMTSLPAALVTNGAANVSIAGTFTGNGANVTNVNAVTLNGLNATNFWRVGGNAGANPANGAFLGTKDKQPLEFWVNTNRALRLEYAYDLGYGCADPNIIGGYASNAALSIFGNPSYGCFIGGGGTAGYPNQVLAGAYASILGGVGNTAANDASTAMGAYTTASGSISTAMGAFTTASGTASTAMGYFTTASGDVSTAMGTNTTASGNSSTAMGYGTIASGNSSTAMGYGTIAEGYASTTLGLGTIADGTGATAMGALTAADGDYSTALGYNTSAGGNSSTAMGYQANATHDAAFVWADDSSSSAFNSTTNREFSIRAQNGVRLQTDKGIHLNADDEPIITRDWNPFAANAPASKQGIGRWGLFMEPTKLTLGIPETNNIGDTVSRYFQVARYSTNGNYTTLMSVDQNGTTVIKGTVTANGVLLTSDRNAKENFAPLNPQTVLAKVASMPVTEWNYKTDDAAQKHIGPMAQDFQAAFGLNGGDDKHISVVDESGVALAAIQGLNEKLETENSELKQELAELKALVQQLAQVRK